MATENLDLVFDDDNTDWSEVAETPDGLLFDQILEGSGDTELIEYSGTGFGEYVGTVSPTATPILDHYTVSRCDVHIRGSYTSGTILTANVTLYVGGTDTTVTQVFSASDADYTLNHSDWNVDWTQAQIDLMLIGVFFTMSGKPSVQTGQVTEMWAVVTFERHPGIGRPSTISRIVNTQTGFASERHESAHPFLWQGHIGSVAPCIIGEGGETQHTLGPKSGGLQGTTNWKIQGNNTSRSASPLGYAWKQINNPSTLESMISVAAGGDLWEIDAPFTLACYIKCATPAAGDDACSLFCSQSPGGRIQSGVLVLVEDDGSLSVSIGDDSDDIMFAAGGRYKVNSDIGIVVFDEWAYLIIVVKSFALPDSGRTVGIDFWRNGQLDKQALATENANSQSIGYDSLTSFSHIGAHTTGTGPEGPEPNEYELALWQLWDRALTVPEVKLLSMDPVAMFRRKPSPMGFVATTTRIVSLGGYVKTTGSRVVLVG